MVVERFMTDRELFKMALDMLDDINQCSLPPTGIPLPAEIDEVMEALRTRLAQPEPEPVAWIKKDRSSIEVSIMSAEYMMEEGFDPLYTAPPQREWQGLTDQEQLEIMKQFGPGQRGLFADAIEAKLREKNA